MMNCCLCGSQGQRRELGLEYTEKLSNMLGLAQRAGSLFLAKNCHQRQFNQDELVFLPMMLVVT